MYAYVHCVSGWVKSTLMEVTRLCLHDPDSAAGRVY